MERVKMNLIIFALAILGSVGFLSGVFVGLNSLK